MSDLWPFCHFKILISKNVPNLTLLLRIKTISAQLKLKLGLSLAIKKSELIGS